MTTYQFSEAEGKAAIAQADAQGTFAALGLESNGDVDESRAISAELASVQAELAAIKLASAGHRWRAWRTGARSIRCIEGSHRICG